MKATHHPTTNAVLGAPLDWDRDSEPPCDDLHVTTHIFEGVHVVTSYWRPTPEELRALADGGLVVLHVAGGGMPPVSLDVEVPAEKPRRELRVWNFTQAQEAASSDTPPTHFVVTKQVHDNIFRFTSLPGRPYRAYSLLNGLPLIVREEGA